MRETSCNGTQRGYAAWRTTAIGISVLSLACAPVPVVTTPELQSCPEMSVPLSAGIATFVDSAVLGRPELGTRFRFRGEENLGLGSVVVDVYIYPGATWSPPAGQAEVFLRALKEPEIQRHVAAFEVITSGRESIRVTRANRTTDVVGHMVRLRMTLASGEARQSYFAVFPDGELYVKFRSTHAPSGAARDAADTIVRQILSARVARPAHCPR